MMTGSDIIMQILVGSGVIPKNYTGEIRLHCGQGALHDIEKVEKVKARRCLGELDNGVFMEAVWITRPMANNTA